jgi:hypothetical protein
MPLTLQTSQCNFCSRWRMAMRQRLRSSAEWLGQGPIVLSSDFSSLVLGRGANGAPYGKTQEWWPPPCN